MLCENCQINGNKVVFPKSDFGDLNKTPTVEIVGGKANGTRLSIIRPINAIISYSTSDFTNTDVTATITFSNRSNVAINNNDGSNEYTFAKNGAFTFEFIDEYGTEGQATARVDWIDKVSPVVGEITNSSVYYDAVTPTVTDANLDTVILTKNGNMVAYSVGDEIVELGTYSLEATDKAGNKTTVVFSIEEKPTPTPTAAPATATPTPTEVPATATPTPTAVPATATPTPTAVPATATPTPTAAPATATPTPTAVPATATPTPMATSNDNITSSVYVVSDNEIKNIKALTTLEEFESNIICNQSYRIVNNNGYEMFEDDYIGTESKIITDNGNTYVAVVIGDTSGDGKITTTDLLNVKKHIVNIVTLEGKYEIAGDISGDGKISPTDLIKTKRVIVGLEEI